MVVSQLFKSEWVILALAVVVLISGGSVLLSYELLLDVGGRAL